MALAVRQTASVTSATGTTANYALNFSSTTLAGSLLVALFGSGSATATIGTDAADTWTALEGGPLTASTKVEMFYAANCVGGKTGYTFTRSTAGTGSLLLMEITGALTASVLDVSTHAIGTTSTAVSTGTAATTAQSTEIWVAGLFGSYASGGSGTFSGLTAGYTLDVQTVSTSVAGTNASIALAHQIVSATGAPAASATLSTNPTGQAGIIVAFKAPQGATLTASSSLAGTGLALLMSAATTLTATSAVAATGLPLLPASPLIAAATSALSSAAIPLIPAIQTLTASSTLSSMGTPSSYGFFSGTGALVGTGTPSTSTSSGTPAPGTFGWLAPSSSLGSGAGMGLIAGTSALAGSGQIIVPDTRTVAVSSSLTSTPLLIRPGSCLLGGTLSLVGLPVPLPEGQGTFTATGALSALGIPMQPATGSLSGAGSLVGLGSPQATQVGTILLTSGLTGVGQQVVQESRTLSGTSALATTAIPAVGAAGALVATSVLTSVAVPYRVGIGTINGLSTLVGTGSLTTAVVGTATLSSVGALTSTGQGIAAGTGLFVANGDLIGSASVQSVAQIILTSDLAGRGAPALPLAQTPHLAFDATVSGPVHATVRPGYPVHLAAGDASLTLVLGVKGIPTTLGVPTAAATATVRLPDGSTTDAPGLLGTQAFWVRTQAQLLVGNGHQIPGATYRIDVALMAGASTIHFIVNLACVAD